MMTVTPFQTEPLTDFTQPAARQAMEEALRAVRSELGREFPLLIDGREVRPGTTFRSINPSQADQTVAVVEQASAEQRSASPTSPNCAAVRS